MKSFLSKITGRNSSTIRSRLLVSFVLMALLPSLAISAGSILVGYYNGRQQVYNQLETVAEVRDLRIQAWVQTLRTELSAPISEEFGFERANMLLDLAQAGKYYSFYSGAMRTRLQRYMTRSSHFTAIYLVDLNGTVILSTDPEAEGRAGGISSRDVQAAAAGLSRIVYDLMPGGDFRLTLMLPVTNLDGRLLGVIAGDTRMTSLQQIMDEQTGLGETGKAYLVTPDYQVAAASRSAGESGPVDVGAVRAAVDGQMHGSEQYMNDAGMPVVGSYRWLPELGMTMLIEQDVWEAFRAVSLMLGVNVAIAAAAVFLAALASMWIARTIAAPVEMLAGTAKVIANGDLSRVAPVSRRDEIGDLAAAFNSMTGQLRGLIGGLEQRVEERTRELTGANLALQRRAVQLETSAKVSREAISILDIDNLLARAVRLIGDAFGYYQVMIFLVDPDTGGLVLRACCLPVSAASHRLPAARGSLNGEAAHTNQAVLVNNVLQDDRYQADEMLPDTRAELVAPLRLGEQVIGTLDVQSDRFDAFDPDDLLVIQSLGDQLAIAIENARLYERNRDLAVLEERNRLARELHDSVTQSLYSLWLLTESQRRVAGKDGDSAMHDLMIQIGEITQQTLKEMRLLVYELRPPNVEQAGLIGALQQRLQAVEHRAKITTELVVEDVVELPPEIEDGLYRIGQEALNNALNHANAAVVRVRLYAREHQVHLEIADNGCGFNVAAVRSGTAGMGLANMRARVEGLAGKLEIQSTPGQGTVVAARVPLPPGPDKKDILPNISADGARND